jgi:hypothetical protein
MGVYSGGKLKARDPDKGIPQELYGPPGDAISVGGAASMSRSSAMAARFTFSEFRGRPMKAYGVSKFRHLIK